MLRLGNSLNDVLYSYAWDGITYTIVSRTLLGALYAGLWPLGLVKAASVLDNPFSIALARADKAGKVLAQALIDGVQGKRPVTLMGYSVGARVIYSCLVELAEQNAFGLVESAVLMGAPVPSDSRSWRQIRSVVAARVVNVYSTEDYILGFLYRSTKLQMGVAGLQEVRDVFGIENADMSTLVNGHDKYRYLIGTILTKIGIEDVDFNKVAEQERALELAERKKEQVRQRVQKQKKDAQQPDLSAQRPSEAIGVRNNNKMSDTLVDLSAPVAAPIPERVASYPAQGPLMMQQNRSGQQPSMRRGMTLPRTNQQTASAQSHVLAPMDPLSGKISLVENSSLPATRPAFPIASRAHQRQVPSNMVPTPPAPPAPKFVSDDEDTHQIVMKDVDDQKRSAPLKETPRTPQSTSALKTTPVVTMVSVEVDDDVDSDDYDEMEGEFGELSMVEPTPLDDNDFGLM
jgi:hypothetical protein